MESAFYPWRCDLYSTTPQQVQAALAETPRDRRLLLWSEEYVPNLPELIATVTASGDLPRTLWQLQPSHPYSAQDLRNLGSSLVMFDKDVVRLSLYLQHCPQQQVRHWDADQQRFLFLLGKPARRNRIRALWLLEQRGLLSRCDWSLRGTTQDLRACRDLLPELTDTQYHDFMRDHQRDLDVIDRQQFTEEYHYGGYPYDADIYRSVVARLICETEMSDVAVITEKTWQTMINHRPFVMLGYQHGLAWLESQGYRVFREYLPVPDYDAIADPDQRLDAAIANIQGLLDAAPRFADRIHQDVRHNARLLRSRFRPAQQALRMLAKHLDSQRSWLAVMPLDLEHQLWLEFYQRVRDPSWPHCWLPEAFDSLPLEIQQECREVFGYPHSCYSGRDVVK